MAKKAKKRKRGSKTDRLLDRVRELADALPSDDRAAAELNEVLGSNDALVVAAAAEVVASAKTAGAVGGLVDAFDRFMTDPIKRDPGCKAKIAIVEALRALPYADTHTFSRGARHVQKEPAWGPPVDTAPPLRGNCARALVEARALDVLDVLADLLADEQWPVREIAAQCVGDHGDRAGAPLLRFKLRIGDDSIEVIGAAFQSLLHLDEDGAIELSASLLRTGEELLRESIALALGESRTRGALNVLMEWWSDVRDPGDRKFALACVAMLRTREAQAALYAIVESAVGFDARDAIGALKPYCADPAIAEQLIEAAARNETEAVLLAAKEAVAKSS